MDSAVAVQPHHVGLGALTVGGLLHAEVRVAQRCDLRQMGHAQHLLARRNLLHLLAHDLRHAPGNAGVDLVEHHGIHAAAIQRDGLHCQHHAGQLAAGGHRGQGLQRFAGIRGDQEFHLLRTLRRGLLQRPEIHAEAAAGHAQILQLLQQAALELLRQRPPGAGQRLADIAKGVILPLELLLQLCDARVAGLNGLQPRLCGISEGDDLVHRRAVLALQAGNQVQTVADPVHQPGIEAQLLAEGLQLRARLLHAVVQALELACKLFKARIQTGDALHGGARAQQRLLGAQRPAVAAVGQLVGRVHAVANLLGILQHAQLALQLLLLAALELRGRDFLHLEAEHVDQPLPLGGVLEQFAQLRGRGRARRMGRMHRRHLSEVHFVAEGVQELHVLRRIHQRLMLVLAVHVHQQRGELLQRRQRQHRARDAADVAPAAAQLPGHADQTAVRIHAQLCGQLQRCRIAGDIEQRLHAALLRAGADHVPVGAAAQRQVHAVYHDGLARAGFARKHIESLRKFDAQRFNQCDISDCQF